MAEGDTGTGGTGVDVTPVVEAVKAMHDDVKAILTEMLELQRHVHEQHWHGGSGRVPRAAALVNEYMGNQDLDGNGMVYGRDFYIDPECSEKPPMLSAIQPADGAVKMTWPEYLSSVGA
jgi:hypothetical protein